MESFTSSKLTGKNSNTTGDIGWILAVPAYIYIILLDLLIFSRQIPSPFSGVHNSYYTVIDTCASTSKACAIAAKPPVKAESKKQGWTWAKGDQDGELNY